MDGENHGKPLFFNGMNWGGFPPIFGNTHTYINLSSSKRFTIVSFKMVAAAGNNFQGMGSFVHLSHGLEIPPGLRVVPACA